MSQDFFEYHIETMKEKYPTFRKYQNYHIFTLLCIKYFFYSESGISFDQDVIEEFLTDGANDGGIDAIFNDPTSEGNDLIIVQSKFYENTALGTDNVAGELYKINETLKKLQSNKISEFNDKLVTAYRNATSQMEDNANIRIVFFTSYQPKNKRERNKLDKSMRDYFGKYDFERSKKLSNERSMDMKLSDFIEIYFSDKQNDLKDRTIKNKRYMMQQHIVPYFGNQMMSEIKASQIIQWQNEIQKKGYSDSYLRMIQNQLTSLFTHAAKIYDLPVNPCKKVKRMGNSDSKSLNFWTLDEYKQFIQTMEPGTRYYLMFEMLFWTGCRIGELLAITKADINFEKNQLSINKTYYRTGMQDIITEPKTKQSFRTIEIPEFLKEEIKEFVDGHYGMPDTERLFPVVQEAVQHKMKRQIELAGVKKIRVHDLRHSHVAYLIEKGVEPLLIRDRLGHKDIRITLNTYGHLYPNQQRKIANLLDNENGNAVTGLGEERDEC